MPNVKQKLNLFFPLNIYCIARCTSDSYEEPDFSFVSVGNAPRSPLSSFFFKHPLLSTNELASFLLTGWVELRSPLIEVNDSPDMRRGGERKGGSKTLPS